MPYGKLILSFCEICGKELKKAFGRFCTICGKLYAQIKRTKSAQGLPDAQLFRRVKFTDQWRKFRGSHKCKGVLA